MNTFLNPKKALNPKNAGRVLKKGVGGDKAPSLRSKHSRTGGLSSRASGMLQQGQAASGTTPTQTTGN